MKLFRCPSDGCDFQVTDKYFAALHHQIHHTSFQPFATQGLIRQLIEELAERKSDTVNFTIARADVMLPEKMVNMLKGHQSVVLTPNSAVSKVEV